VNYFVMLTLVLWQHVVFFVCELYAV